jgi:hypothetical protein
MNARRGLATFALAFLLPGAALVVASYAVRVEAAEPSDPFPTWDSRIADPSKRFAPRFAGIGRTVGAYLDRETGLVWTASPSEVFADWDDAFAHCAALTVGGVSARGGWRLPSVEELTTLLPVPSSPFLPFFGFFRFWSTTGSPTDPSRVYTVGSDSDAEITEKDKSTVDDVAPWCVRGGRGFDGID